MERINDILNYIDEQLKDGSNWHMIRINNNNQFKVSYKDISISNDEGLYFIKTNIDKNKFNLLPPMPNDEKHYNLKDRFKNPVYSEINYNYHEDEYGYYVVYNGEDKEVLNRIQAHMKGHKGNACLAIGKYSFLVKDKAWKIACIYMDDIISKFGPIYPEINNIQVNSKESKSLRLLLESGWRYRNIWPIFCKK